MLNACVTICHTGVQRYVFELGLTVVNNG